MHIAVVTLDYPPYRSSGLTVYAESVVRALVRRGHSVTVIASARSADSWTEAARVDDSGINVERLRVVGLDWIGLGLQAARYLRTHQCMFDAVHFMDVHFAYAYREAFTASILQSFRQRLVSSRAGPYHTHWRNYLFRLIYYSVAKQLMERPAAARARHLVATSSSTQREFVKHYGVEPKRTSIIYIGIDPRRFADLPSQTVARERLQLPSDLPVLLYVGFSTPRKGLEHLARALGMMQVQAHLVIVGKWETGYLHRFMEALGGARSRVTITGYVTDDIMPHYYAAADLFVLPTLLEGFGIPLVEAMAAGTPVVTTDGGAAGEIVGSAGLVVPRADSQALAAALDRVLMDPGLANLMRSLGRDRAQLFAEEPISEQIDDLFVRVWSANA